VATDPIVAFFDAGRDSAGRCLPEDICGGAEADNVTKRTATFWRDSID
jgi:hypothetical protein